MYTVVPVCRCVLHRNWFLRWWRDDKVAKEAGKGWLKGASAFFLCTSTSTWANALSTADISWVHTSTLQLEQLFSDWSTDASQSAQLKSTVSKQMHIRESEYVNGNVCMLDRWPRRKVDKDPFTFDLFCRLFAYLLFDCPFSSSFVPFLVLDEWTVQSRVDEVIAEDVDFLFQCVCVQKDL